MAQKRSTGNSPLSKHAAIRRGLNSVSSGVYSKVRRRRFNISLGATLSIVSIVLAVSGFYLDRVRDVDRLESTIISGGVHRDTLMVHVAFMNSGKHPSTIYLPTLHLLENDKAYANYLSEVGTSDFPYILEPGAVWSPRIQYNLKGLSDSALIVAQRGEKLELHGYLQHVLLDFRGHMYFDRLSTKSIWIRGERCSEVERENDSTQFVERRLDVCLGGGVASQGSNGSEVLYEN